MSGFSPYSDNGGTIAGIAGKDYVVIAADSRLKSGYGILSRAQNKLYSIDDGIVLATSRCWPDVLTLRNQIAMKYKLYESDYGDKMTVEPIAQMLSIMLYYKRFFPYYVNTILAGLTKDGKGALYSYDPLGHFESSSYFATGEAGSLIQPLLDNRAACSKQGCSQEDALFVVRDAFISAAERETSVGDEIDVAIVTANGTTKHKFPLRKD